MCGLLGFNGKNVFDPLKIKILFLYNETRGKDSCGVYSSDDFDLENFVGKSSEVMLPDIDLTPSKVLIGHTRAMTSGIINIENSHPFLFKGKKNIIGAHNGTLTNFVDLKQKYKEEFDTKELNVDSKILFKYFSEKPDFNILGELKGGAAVLFSDLNKSDTLHCFRNDDRPLFRGNYIGEGMYFSSIKKSLEVIGCSDIKEIKSKYMYSITDGAIRSAKKIKSAPYKHIYKAKPVEEKYKPEFNSTPIRFLDKNWRWDRTKLCYFRFDHHSGQPKRIWDFIDKLDEHIYNIDTIVYEGIGSTYDTDYDSYQLTNSKKETYRCINNYYFSEIKNGNPFYKNQIHDNDMDLVSYFSINAEIVAEFNEHTQTGIVFIKDLAFSLGSEKINKYEEMETKIKELTHSIMSLDSNNNLINEEFVKNAIEKKDDENLNTLLTELLDVILLQQDYFDIVSSKLTIDSEENNEFQKQGIINSLLENGEFIKNICTNRAIVLDSLLKNTERRFEFKSEAE